MAFPVLQDKSQDDTGRRTGRKKGLKRLPQRFNCGPICLTAGSIAQRLRDADMPTVKHAYFLSCTGLWCWTHISCTSKEASRGLLCAGVKGPTASRAVFSSSPKMIRLRLTYRYENLLYSRDPSRVSWDTATACIAAAEILRCLSSFFVKAGVQPHPVSISSTENGQLHMELRGKTEQPALDKCIGFLWSLPWHFGYVQLPDLGEPLGLGPSALQSGD